MLVRGAASGALHRLIANEIFGERREHGTVRVAGCRAASSKQHN
jgi:hypothetical protein